LGALTRQSYSTQLNNQPISVDNFNAGQGKMFGAESRLRENDCCRKEASSIDG
jgi:hypothetical protein